MLSQIMVERVSEMERTKSERDRKRKIETKIETTSKRERKNKSKRTVRRERDSVGEKY